MSTSLYSALVLTLHHLQTESVYANLFFIFYVCILCRDFNNAGGRAALDFSVLFQIFVLFIFGAQQVERLSIITNAWFPTVLVLIISFVHPSLSVVHDQPPTLDSVDIMPGTYSLQHVNRVATGSPRSTRGDTAFVMVKEATPFSEPLLFRPVTPTRKSATPSRESTPSKVSATPPRKSIPSEGFSVPSRESTTPSPTSPKEFTPSRTPSRESAAARSVSPIISRESATPSREFASSKESATPPREFAAPSRASTPPRESGIPSRESTPSRDSATSSRKFSRTPTSPRDFAPLSKQVDPSAHPTKSEPVDDPKARKFPFTLLPPITTLFNTRGKAEGPNLPAIAALDKTKNAATAPPLFDKSSPSDTESHSGSGKGGALSQIQCYASDEEYEVEYEEEYEEEYDDEDLDVETILAENRRRNEEADQYDEDLDVDTILAENRRTNEEDDDSDSSSAESRDARPPNKFRAPASCFPSQSSQRRSATPPVQQGNSTRIDISNGCLPSRFGSPASRYGTPASRYGTPASRYGTPASRYGTPERRYGTPASRYGTPESVA